jgi:hypothetical protein
MLMLAMLERGGQDVEKETYPCCHRYGSSCIARVRGRCRGKVDGKKKVMGKERRMKELKRFECVDLKRFQPPPTFPLTKFLVCAKVKCRPQIGPMWRETSRAFVRLSKGQRFYYV